MRESHDEEQNFWVEDDDIEGFVMLPKAILRRDDLSRDAKLLYAVLLDYAWQDTHCWPGYDRLIADLHCGRTLLSNCLKELRAIGALESKRRGQGKTSLYTLRIRVGTQKSQDGTTRNPGDTEAAVPPRDLTNTQVKKTQRDKDISRSRRAPTEQFKRTELESYVADFRREFRDQATLGQSLSRAVGLWEQSGMSRDVFVAAMYQAREQTKSATKVENRMTYWFACLERLVGE